MKIKLERKKLFVITFVLIAIILTVIALILKPNKQVNVSNPELIRAQSYELFEDQDEDIESTNNVKFSSFFLRDINGDGFAEKIKGTCKEIGKDDTLYLELKVQTEGYLKNAKIEIVGQNFYFQTSLPKDDELNNNYIGNNVKELCFNNITSGTQKLMTGFIKSGDYSYKSRMAQALGNNINNLSRNDNKVILTGTYVQDDGQEIEIRKEINLIVDWYGTTNTAIKTDKQEYFDISDRVDEDNASFTVNFDIITNETEQKLKIGKNTVTATIPELSGYAPLSVKCLDTNVEYTYDETTKKFTLERNAEIDENGNITKSVSYDNTYKIEVVYPLEAYNALTEDTISILIPIEATYEGINNSNSEFENPYISTNKAVQIINYRHRLSGTETEPEFKVTVGKVLNNPDKRYIVSKENPINIYNGVVEEVKDDIYTVRWEVYTGENKEASELIMKETNDGEAKVSDLFIKEDATTESMENITANVGIYFLGADDILNEDGYINVYDDETGDLLVQFTKENWNNYTITNPYLYDLPIKHIRLETSETKAKTTFYVYNLKELDNNYITEHYTKEEFDNFKYIQSRLVGYFNGKHRDALNEAIYELPYSIATIQLNNNTLSTQVTEENGKIIISANYNKIDNQVGWLDGSFLVKFPEEILDVEVNNVSIDNPRVEIVYYEVIEKDGCKLIKINTENISDVEELYQINIDAKITADPRVATVNKNIELYASNEAKADYYKKSTDIYDVNNNLNTTELVNKDDVEINIIAPNTLLTTQSVYNFDETGSKAIAPRVADVELKYNEKNEIVNTATIDVQIKNNYSDKISDIDILGKIPFEGNTYVIKGDNLNSTFSTYMDNTGIKIPEELVGKVDVYYSENETPTRDLDDTANGWKTAKNVEDWMRIKTYLIHFNDYQMEPGKEYLFSYNVEFADNVELKQESYSHHAVYFCLNTNEGKYKSQVEPNKTGLRVAKKFNLELLKYQTRTEKLVAGATYCVKEIKEDGTIGEKRTGITNADGILTINSLYAEKTYEIEELRSPSNYEKSSEVIRFIAHADENITVEKISGQIRKDFEVSNENDIQKVTVAVEDNVNGILKIVKTKQGTDEKLANIKFRIKGYGISKNGKIVTTNSNGEALVEELKINEEYLLEEVKADGYYLCDPIKFKITNDAVEIIEGTLKQATMTQVDYVPTVNLEIENTNIPKYNLEITKVKKVIELNNESLKENNITALQGAKFKLYRDGVQIGEYITDANGKITINDLYQYVEGEKFDSTYTLKEVMAPEGYAKAKDIVFKVQEQDGQLIFNQELNNGQIASKYTSEGNLVKLTIEDNPAFRLVKKDGETGEVLPNIKFAIYDVENGDVPAKNSKGEILGTKEVINGQEYYVLTTDVNGEITTDLPEGYYKAVELQAPDKYEISEKEYYFGIGKSKNGRDELEAKYAKVFGGDNDDTIDRICELTNGKFVAVGSFASSKIDFGNNIVLTNRGSYDGFIVGFNESLQPEWGHVVGGEKADSVYRIEPTADGGCIVGGTSHGAVDAGNGVALEWSKGYTDAIVIKYNANGEAEWGNKIGGNYYDQIEGIEPTLDGGCIATGFFNNTVKFENDMKITSNGGEDGFIVKYNSIGEMDWIKTIGGTGADSIKSVTLTSDGGFLITGYFERTINLENGTVLTSNGNKDVMLIKYNSENEIEWANTFGGSEDEVVSDMVKDQNGDYVIAGTFCSANLDLGNNIVLENKGVSNAFIIKYAQNGQIKWAKSYGGNKEQAVYFLINCKDGGYIVGGENSADFINLENKTQLLHYGSGDGVIIKYNYKGNVEWGRIIGGGSNDSVSEVIEVEKGEFLISGSIRSNDITLENKISPSIIAKKDGILLKCEIKEKADVSITNIQTIKGTGEEEQIKSMVNTTDGGYIIGGCTESETLNVNDQITLRGNGSRQGLVIKYNNKHQVEWAKIFGGTELEHIKSVDQTLDGGYIVGGIVNSSNIQLDENTTFNNHGGSDGILIKYDEYGEIEWTKAVGGSSDDQILAVKATPDGGFVAGGYIKGSNINIGNGIIFNTNSGKQSAVVIKYNEYGEVEWAKCFGNWYSASDIQSLVVTSDGGIVVTGTLSGEVSLENGIKLNGQGSYTYAIKYTINGEIEWTKTIDGEQNEYGLYVIETLDGGIALSGSTASENIDLGNNVKLQGKANDTSGYLVKLNSKGEAEWAKLVDGINKANDITQPLVACNDGSIIAGTYYQSKKINLEDKIIVTNITTRYNEG